MPKLTLKEFRERRGFMPPGYTPMPCCDGCGADTHGVKGKVHLTLMAGAPAGQRFQECGRIVYRLMDDGGPLEEARTAIVLGAELHLAGTGIPLVYRTRCALCWTMTMRLGVEGQLFIEGQDVISPAVYDHSLAHHHDHGKGVFYCYACHSEEWGRLK